MSKNVFVMIQMFILFTTYSQNHIKPDILKSGLIIIIIIIIIYSICKAHYSQINVL